MGIYLNPDSSRFEEAINSDIYIDKTGLLEYTNSVLHTMQKYLCISRPRRFGKSIAANMIAAYYSRGCNTKQMFDGFEIAKSESFEKYLNQYNTISVNMQEIYARFDDYKERLLPQLPGMAKKASKTLLSIGSALSYIVGALIFIITPAILFLLGSSWQPFENVTAFPVLSIVTLVALGGVGLFGGLTCVFVGTELRGVRERYFRNVD